jgi:hypothetical protein
MYGASYVLFDQRFTADEQPCGWPVTMLQNFYSSSNVDDRRQFIKPNECKKFDDVVPVIRGAMIDQYDHIAAVFNPISELFESTDRSENSKIQIKSDRYVTKTSLLEKTNSRGWEYDWLLGWRDITNSTNWRTVISTITPLAAADDTFSLLLPKSNAPVAACFLLANLNSIVFDYVAGNKVGGTHIRKYVMSQFPFIPQNKADSNQLNFIVPRILELVFNSMDLLSFYRDVVKVNSAWDHRSAVQRGSPWKWDSEKRAIIKSELDAKFAHLYGLTRNDLCYILDPTDVMESDYPSQTFRVLKDREIRNLGEYRTRRLVLDAWDKLEQGDL